MTERYWSVEPIPGSDLWQGVERRGGDITTPGDNRTGNRIIGTVEFIRECLREKRLNKGCT